MKPPPRPIDPVTATWTAPLYRVHGNRRRPGEFNPGVGPPTRWAFFGDPLVPVLYAAQSPEAAVAETLLHDVPLVGGRLFPESYLDRVMSRIEPRRPLTLARLAAGGLRRIGVRQGELTDTEADRYRETVAWAEAIWRDTPCDGIEWVSRHWNTSRAVVLFGDRVRERELDVDPGFARAFANPSDLAWLAELCERTRVLLVPPA